MTPTASSPAPSAASAAAGSDNGGASVGSVASAAADVGTTADAVADADANDMMKATNEQIKAEQEDDGSNFCALLQWLRTFPHLAEVIIAEDDGISGCDFGDVGVVRAILEAVKELYGVDESANNDANSDNASPLNLWEQTLTTAGISNIMAEALVRTSDPSSTDTSDITLLLSTMLCRAVSAECSMQKTYIGRIMDLGSDLQMSLMKIISEANKNNGDGANNSSSNDNDDDDNICDDVTVGGTSVASVASVMESIRSSRKQQQRGRDVMSPLSRSGYTPQRKKRATDGDGDDEQLKQRPLSAVRMHRNVNDEIFSPVGSVFSPTATAADANGNTGGSRSTNDQSTVSCNSKKEIQELRDKLEFVGNELKVSRQRETELGLQLEDIDSKHRAEKMKIEADSIAREKDIGDKYAEELSLLRKEVEELRGCRKDAQDAKEELDALRDEVDVLQHTKEKLASTDEQFRKCREKLEQMGDAKDALVKAEEAHGSAVARSLELENELKSLQPLRRQLEDYKTRAVDAEVKLTECQGELQNLQKLSSELRGANKELKQGVMIHQSETEGLRKRLLEDNESSTGAKGPAVGEGLSELNPALMAEVENLRNENTRLRAFAAEREDDSVQKLEESLDDNQRLAQRYKEQFLATKNELQETQQALRDSMLREEKLRLEITTLNNDVSNLQNELKDEQLASQKALLDAEKTLQETKQGLIDKAREDMENIENKMNGLLEDEQNRCKEALAKAEDEKKLIEEQSSRSLADLKEESSSTLKSARDEAEQRIGELEKQHSTALEKAAAKAEEEREKLVAKGKGMIKEIKTKAQEKLRATEEAHAAEKEEIKEMCSKFQQEQQEYEEKARAKIAQYKQKLHVATGRQNDLIQEAEQLQEKLKKLEREKMALQGDNDRYRRQLGCQFGSGSGIQKQFETLQQEFNEMLEENKRLKKKMAEGGASPFEVGVHFHSQSDGAAASSSRHYVGSGGTKDTSTISHLRAEYEDTIQTLQDEKRELVMKNSAAISDAQKADQRSWELEEDLNKVKNELTSTKLLLQRMERQATPIDSSFSKMTSPDHANTSIQSFHTTVASPETKDSGGQDVNNPAIKENIHSNTKSATAQASGSDHSNKNPRSLIECTQLSQSSGAGEGKQECQQS